MKDASLVLETCFLRQFFSVYCIVYETDMKLMSYIYKPQKTYTR